MKKLIKELQHQLNNELAKIFPMIELMAEDPEANHAPKIKKIAAVVDQITEETQQLASALNSSQSRELRQLSYISKYLPTGAGIEIDIEKILSKARPFNHDYDVTGLLVYHSGYFIQYLEGTQEDLYTVYGRICMDPRHENPVVLSQGPITERNFMGWDMDYFIITNAEESFMSGLYTKFTAPDKKVTSDDVLSFLNLIKSFKIKK